MEIIKGITPNAWMILLYGKAGIGKSTLASFAPGPLFLDFENGLARIDCARTPTIESYEEMIEAYRYAYSAAEYKTIVSDTVGAMEILLAKKILTENKKTSLADIPYGRGFEMLNSEWVKLLSMLDSLRKSGKNLLFIGHEVIEKFQDPLSEDYDRYSFNVHKKVTTHFVAKMDAVLFAKYETFLRDKDHAVKLKAIGTGKRSLHTEDSPAFLAKNRFNLNPVEEFTGEFWSKLL